MGFLGLIICTNRVIVLSSQGLDHIHKDIGQNGAILGGFGWH